MFVLKDMKMVSKQNFLKRFFMATLASIAGIGIFGIDK